MRSRITITLSPDLLSKIDDTIDTKTIRNRSQAIENLLRELLYPRIKTAIILAGGKPLTHPQTHQLIPAPLMPIKNKPLIHHTLEHLKNHGFEHVIIALPESYFDQIKSSCGSGEIFGLKISYSKEKKPLGTGGAVKKARTLIPNAPFLVVHGDVITNINLGEFTRFFMTAGKTAAVAIKPRPGRNTYGTIYLEGNQVTDFQDSKDDLQINLINTGIYLFDSQIATHFPKADTFKLEQTLLKSLIASKQITGYVFQGIWFDISNEKDYSEANQRWFQ